MGLSNNDTYVAVAGQIADGIISLAKLDTAAIAALKPGWTFVSATTLSADASKDVTLSSNEHHMVILNVSLSSAAATLKLTAENATGTAQYLTFDSGNIVRVNASATFFNVGKVLNANDKVSGQIVFNRTPDVATYTYYSGTCNSANGTTSMYSFLGGQVGVSAASTKLTFAPTAGTISGQILLFKAATS